MGVDMWARPGPEARVEAEGDTVPFLKGADGQTSLLGASWTVLQSRGWARAEHITALEGRALSWCSRHAFRSDRAMGTCPDPE